MPNLHTYLHPGVNVCKIGIYHLCSDLFPSLQKFASYLRWANLKQTHFFVQFLFLIHFLITSNLPFGKTCFFLSISFFSCSFISFSFSTLSLVSVLFVSSNSVLTSSLLLSFPLGTVSSPVLGSVDSSSLPVSSFTVTGLSSAISSVSSAGVWLTTTESFLLPLSSSSGSSSASPGFVFEGFSLSL